MNNNEKNIEKEQEHYPQLFLDSNGTYNILVEKGVIADIPNSKKLRDYIRTHFLKKKNGIKNIKVFPFLGEE